MFMFLSLEIRVGGRAVANIQHSVKEDRRLVASERQSIESVFDIAKASTDPGESISDSTWTGWLACCGEMRFHSACPSESLLEPPPV
jgi:hypothetical protein